MLPDSEKTKAQLIEELESLRSRVAAFEQMARRANAWQRSDIVSALYSAAPIGLCYLDTELRFVFINEWLADINGLSVEQHVGRKVGEVLPDVATGVEWQFRHVIETGEPIIDGMVVAETPAHPEVKRHLQHNYLPIKSNDGTVVGISCVVQDVTERKQAEESLRLTQFALDHAANPIYWVREDGRIFYANNAACQSLGYSRDELLSMFVPEIDPNFPTEVWPAHWQEMKKSGRLTFEAHHRTKDGRVFPVEITTNYLTNGPHEFVWAYVRDVTERRRAEEALRRSEALYRTILEAAPQIIWQAEADGACSYINQAWEDIVGMPKEEALGSGWATVIHPDDARGLLVKWERAYAHGESYSGECRFQSKDGSYRTFDFVGLPIRDTSGKITRWVGINTDITERKQAEEALLESQALYESLVAHIPQMIFRKDLEGRCTYASPRLCESLRCSSKEVVGKTDFDFFPRTLAEKYRRDDARVISSGETLELTEEHEAPGGTIQYVQVVKTPIYDSQQRIVGVQGFFWDITEQKRTEEAIRQRENELAHAGRLSLMGEMVAGLAHEVNQPVYSIGNFSKACENHIEQNETVETDKLSQWLGEISACARQSKEVLARLKGFARQSVPRRKALRIDRAIDESIKMLEFELRNQDVAVDYERAERAEDITVRADDVQVQQVLANLIRNACEAFASSGGKDARLTIRTKRRDGFCEVSIKDNGPGMHEEQIKRAFQSFSTTKDSGLGLGLTISRTIVEGHGGELAITPNRHRGITCHFSLPLTRGDQ